MSREVRRAERRARQAELPFWRQGSFVAAAVFIGAVVIAGLFLLFTSGPRPEQAAEPPAIERPDPGTETSRPEATETTAAAPQTTEPQPGPDGDGCPALGSGTGQDALQTPPDVEWSPVGDVATAASATDGPAEREGPKRCYAQTAAGALLASYNFAADSNSGLVSLRELTEQRVLPSAPMYDQLIRSSDRTPGGTPFAAVAYRFVNASDEEYVVSIVYQVAQQHAPAMVEWRHTMRWVEGDWMLADGGEITQISEIPAGYIEWGPHVGAPE